MSIPEVQIMVVMVTTASAVMAYVFMVHIRQVVF